MRYLIILVSVFVFGATQDTTEKCKIVSKRMDCEDASEQDLPKTPYPDVNWLTITKSNVPVIKASMLKNLPKLGNLHAGGVGIEKVEDDAFKSSKQLDWIDLSTNKIKAISPNLVEDLNVIFFNISHNPGLAIPEGKPFLKSETLRWLAMRNCEITTVFPETFRSLPALSDLSLSGNKLTTLPQDIFKNNRRILAIDLAGNQIKVLSDKIFANWFAVVARLEDNPWVCDCNLAPLLKWSKRNVVKGEIKCAQPAGSTWKDMTNLKPCTEKPINNTKK